MYFMTILGQMEDYPSITDNVTIENSRRQAFDGKELRLCTELAFQGVEHRVADLSGQLNHR